MNNCINCETVLTVNSNECDVCQHIRAYAERDSGRDMTPLSKACYSCMFEHFADLHNELGIDSRQEGYEVAKLASEDHGKTWAYAEHFKYFRDQMMAA